MMNSVERFSSHASDNPGRCALWLPGRGGISYGELAGLAAGIQRELLAGGLRPGDPVLVVLGLGFELYATVAALLALGCPVLLVEPWLSVERIGSIIRATAPRAFVTGTMGRLWGIRVPAIRRIPMVLDPRRARASAPDSLRTEKLELSHPGILTFTSGTTAGTPRGIARSQGYLLAQLEVFEKSLHPHEVDWCIFANFALANLGMGRTTLLMPPAWTHFDEIAALPAALRPGSLTCGPTFLEMALNHGAALAGLRAVHVGGALTDCATFERAFAALPQARFQHVYGGTEAEPVALMDARESVRLSREAGYLQVLALGRPVPEIRHRIDEKGLWVSGPHVASTGAAGGDWHPMGDRVKQDSQGRLWYAGRTSQAAADFELEQRIHATLGHTRSFLHRSDRLWLLGEGVVGAEARIRSRHPEIFGIEDLRIYRDARHRARIDRALSIKRGATWLVG